MKHLSLLFLVIACMLSSCNNQNADASISSANEALVKQYFAHFNQHEWEKMANMYTETADFKDPSLGQGVVKQTRTQTIEKYKELNQIFPNLHDEVMQIYPSGQNHIIVEFVSSGTAPDNSNFTLPICTIFTIENGKITKDFTYYDNFDENEAEGASK